MFMAAMEKKTGIFLCLGTGSCGGFWNPLAHLHPVILLSGLQLGVFRYTEVPTFISTACISLHGYLFFSLFFQRQPKETELMYRIYKRVVAD